MTRVLAVLVAAAVAYFVMAAAPSVPAPHGAPPATASATGNR